MFINKSIRITSYFFLIFVLMISPNLFPISKCAFESIHSNWGDNFYYSYDQLTDLIVKLQEKYPEIFSYYSLGETYERRHIWCVKISDNVTADEDEPEVLFMGGVHGNERPGYQTVIYTLKAIAENYTIANVNHSFTNRIRNIVNNTELYFIPMVNPDGVESGTRKNRQPNDCIFGDTIFRGVDINRNFAYKWEELDKHPFKYIFGGFPKRLDRTTVKYPFLDFQSIIRRGNYRGQYPFSENESRAIKQFIENHNITFSIDYHIYGEKILYPWSWTKEPTIENALFVSIAGNISNINGYEIIQGSYWYYIPGCSGDGMYAKHNIYSFTIELCKSSFLANFPLKKRILDLCKTHLLVNLYASERSLEIE